MGPSDEADFREYVAPRMGRLRRMAYLVCRDWHTADDVVGIVLDKLYRHWPRRAGIADLDAYVGGMIARAAIDEKRRPWRREQASDGETLGGHPTEAHDSVADRMTLDSYLARLGRRRRAVLVLRFYCDLSVEETAEVLGISTGTVKSQSARARHAARDVRRGNRPGARVMSYRTAFESTITDEPPTRLDLDALIRRSRRRQRRLRVAAAAVLGLIAIVAGPVGLNWNRVATPGPGSPGASTPIEHLRALEGDPPTEPPATAIRRLDAGVQDAILTVAPGATLAGHFPVEHRAHDGHADGGGWVGPEYMFWGYQAVVVDSLQGVIAFSTGRIDTRQLCHGSTQWSCRDMLGRRARSW